MSSSAAGARQSEASVSVSDVWVGEKGLPHACHGQTANDLGGRILFATDLGPASRGVEERALELAGERNASLLAIAIVKPNTALSHLDEIGDAARQRGIALDTEVASGDPVEVILRAAPAAGSTGIIVGDHQWRGEMQHPCLCAPLIRQAAVPVLVLRTQDDASCALDEPAR
jgi:nucleotide-binding universal stress UspA family protein